MYSFSITNLKYWGNSEQIISKTLQLLSDLSVGYGTVRKLVKLEEVGFLLSNHTAAHYPFLGVGVSVTEMRCRSVLSETPTHVWQLWHFIPEMKVGVAN